MRAGLPGNRGVAELERHRADAARERDELRELLEDRARTLTEARDAQQDRGYFGLARFVEYGYSLLGMVHRL